MPSKRTAIAVTGRIPVFLDRVDRIQLADGRSVVIPAQIMTGNCRAFVGRAFADVAAAKRITFLWRGEEYSGAEPQAFCIAMIKLWCSDALPPKVNKLGKEMLDELFATCQKLSPDAALRKVKGPPE